MILFVAIISIALAYQASTDMVTLGGGAFAGGFFAVADRCTRRNGVINGRECLQAVLFEILIAAIYGIGRYGQETGAFKRESYEVNKGFSSMTTLPISVLEDYERTSPENRVKFGSFSVADVEGSEQWESYEDDSVFHVFNVKDEESPYGHHPAVIHRFYSETRTHEVSSLNYLMEEGVKRQIGNNDRWVYSYAANSQSFGLNQEHYPNVPVDTIEQMSYDLLGRLDELGADNIRIDINGQLGKWGKLQVANGDTQGGIGPTQCESYYNNDYADGNRWHYTYQVHDEL